MDSYSSALRVGQAWDMVPKRDRHPVLQTRSDCLACLSHLYIGDKDRQACLTQPLKKQKPGHESGAGMKPLTTGVTLRKRNTDAEFSFDFDEPGDYADSVMIVAYSDELALTRSWSIGTSAKRARSSSHPTTPTPNLCPS